MKSPSREKLGSVEILKPKTNKIIKRVFILFCFFIPIMMFSCFANLKKADPFEYGMAKWEGDNCELYIFERYKHSPPPGILVYYDKNGVEHIYDVVYDVNVIFLYEHRNNKDDIVNEIAVYSLNPFSFGGNKVSYTSNINSILDTVLPENIILRKKENFLNIDDMPYKYCYGDPSKLTKKKWYCYSSLLSYLYISDDGKKGTLIGENENKEEMEYNVTFDSEQIMTVYDKCTNEKIVSYYIYCQSNDKFYAIMKEKFDENCTWKDYMWFD